MIPAEVDGEPDWGFRCHPGTLVAMRSRDLMLADRVLVGAVDRLAREGNTKGLAAFLDQAEVRRSPAIREMIAEKLGRLGGAPAVQALSRLMSASEGPAVRRRAAAELGRIGDPGASPALRGALTDRDDALVALCCGALLAIGDRSSEPDLTPLLGHPDWSVRAKAARALGSVGSGDSVPALIACLGDTRRQVRIDAAQALAAIGDERAQEPLEEAARDSGALRGFSIKRARRRLERRLG